MNVRMCMYWKISKMNILLFIFLIFQTEFLNAEEKSGFLLLAPSSFLLGSEELICVSLHNSTAPVRVQATLQGAFSSQVLATSTSVVEKQGGCVKIAVGSNGSDDQLGRLVVRLKSADSQLTTSGERTVRLQKEPVVVLVSTDKPQYKPGQQVQFRVLSLNHKFKPHNEKVDKVWVETPSGVRVQQWTDVEIIKHGLTQFSFILDKEAFLGPWKIKVQYKRSNVVQKTFWVKEYVRQKFEIKIMPPTEILPDSKHIAWYICAKYTYGQPVQGEVLVEIKLEGSLAADQPTINNAIKLDKYSGCANVSVKGSELGLSDPLVRPTSVHVTTSVTELSTQTTHSASVSSPVHNQPFTLHLQCSQYFKPGLPYKGKVTMRTMDGRLRTGVGEKIQLCAKARYSDQLSMKLLFCWNYTTDYSSSVTFALPNIADPLQVQLITLIASATDYPTKLYPGTVEVMMLQPTVSQNVKPWFSPSHSYMDVWTHTSLTCGTIHTVTVYYSVPSVNMSTPVFYYALEARGDLLMLNSVVPEEEVVVHSNEVSGQEVSLVRSWKIRVAVTHEMSPRSRISVYYVRGDGEVVAASTNLQVDRCFQNKVRVRWQETQVVPKQNVQLCVRASPDSLCSVAVTDTQVKLNSSENSVQLEREHVWSSLDRFKLEKPIRDTQRYCEDKFSGEEGDEPPTYELRRRRSLWMAPEDASDHVDTITAFNDMGLMVISNLMLESRPCIKSAKYEDMYRRSWIFSPSRGRSPTSVTADNLLLVSQAESTSQTEEMEQQLIRDFFPETWLWSLVDVGKEGEVRVNTSAPDSITSWESQVVCVSARDGLGLAAGAPLSVFVPFFVELELPYSVKKGENVTIKANVYNYLHHSFPIKLSLPASEGLTLVPGHEVTFCLDKQSPSSHSFSLAAHTVGMVNVTITAQVTTLDNCGPRRVPFRSDTVTKQLIVKHEGYTQQKIQSAFICPSESSNPSVSWDLQLPASNNLVPGTASVQFSVMADLLGPALENLDALVTMPMGCGEQNLAKLAPNIFVLKYLNSLNLNSDRLKETAIQNIKKGYQRQLLFQRKDCSFSAFGDKDESGSIWLTAAVVKVLHEAKSFINVDSKVLECSATWIINQQLENGCFSSFGQMFSANAEEEETDDSTTFFSALVVANLAGLDDMLPSSFKTDAEFCLKAAASSTDVYTLSLATLALVRLGLRNRAQQSLQQILEVTVEGNDLTHWGKPDSSLSYNLVVTSNVVLSLVKLGGTENLLIAQKAVRWIATHRNENGGFISTQDTVVALEALTAYVSALPTVKRTELMVLLTGGEIRRTFRLTDDNRLLRQQLVSSAVPPTLTATVVGEGCALVQSVLRYNIKKPAEGSLLSLQVTTYPVSSVDTCSAHELRLCTATTQHSQMVNMALLTVLMVTGYTPDLQLLKKISHPSIKKWEEEVDQIAFYLTDVTNVPICFTLPLLLNFEVENPLPAVVTLIDYYNPAVLTYKEYSLECEPTPPLDDAMLLDNPIPQDDRFEHFHNVDFELETPSGDEGPKPIFVCPPNSSLPNCKH